MSDEMNPASDLAPLADALKALVPATTGMSRDRLLFEAGRSAAASRLTWLWPAGTVLFAGLSFVLVGFIAFSERPTQTVVVQRERIVEVPVPVPVDNPQPSPPNFNEVVHVDSGPNAETLLMFQMRRDVLRWGVSMLPPSKPVEKTPKRGDSTRDLERWLDVPSGTFTAPYSRTSVLFPMIKGDD